MNKRERNRHILGYAVGILVFGMIVPFLIYAVSTIRVISFPIPLLDSTFVRLVLSIPLFVIGLLFVLWSNIDLFYVGKGGPTDVFDVEISPRSQRLVVTGPYRFTRNPMVFGVYSVYVSLAIFLNALASLILCLLLLTIIICYLKRTEEKRLLKDFGDDYRKYKADVSMIIPLPRKKTNRLPT